MKEWSVPVILICLFCWFEGLKAPQFLKAQANVCRQQSGVGGLHLSQEEGQEVCMLGMQEHFLRVLERRHLLPCDKIIRGSSLTFVLCFLKSHLSYPIMHSVAKSRALLAVTYTVLGISLAKTVECQKVNISVNQSILVWAVGCCSIFTSLNHFKQSTIIASHSF